jgi:hypothetical protein
MTHEEARALIDARFTTGLDAAQNKALRAHLRENAASRRYYDKVADLEAAMGGDVAVEARLHALGAPEPAHPVRRRRGWIVGLAAAAAIALGVGLWLRPTTPEWGVKSGGGTVEAGIRLFRKPASGAVQAVEAEVTRGDGLLVSYTNPKDGPRHLGVVARDATGQLRWIQPAWTDPKARPTAIPIEQGVADRELPQVVHHDLPAGALEVCAIFVDTPRAVPDWDAELSRSWPPKTGRCQQVTVR